MRTTHFLFVTWVAVLPVHGEDNCGDNDSGWVCAEVSPLTPSTRDLVCVHAWGTVTWPVGWPSMRAEVDGEDIRCDVPLKSGAVGRTAGAVFIIGEISWSRLESVGPLQEGEYAIRVFAGTTPWEFFEPVVELCLRVTDKQFVLSHDSLTISEGESVAFTVSLLSAEESVEANALAESPGHEIAILAGNRMFFEPDNHSVPRGVVVTAVDDADSLDEQAVVRLVAPGYVPAEVQVLILDDDRPAILYVDSNAPGAASGASWHDAFPDLQQALSHARESGNIREIRVAGGPYTPAGRNGDREAYFWLVDGVALRGGYAGAASTDPDRRDPLRYPTVLSGDLNGDDGSDFSNRDDNASTVVVSCSCRKPTSLEGFTVVGAESSGIWIGSGSTTVTISNCVVAWNRGENGGGMYIFQGGPTVRSCVFLANVASIRGGGLSISCIAAPPSPCVAVPRVTNCTFLGNSSAVEGGGLSCWSRRAVIENCIFWGNLVEDGRGEHAQVSDVRHQLRYCVVEGWSGGLGGLGNFGDDPLFANVGDYHLSETSPCVDGGSPQRVLQWEETDADGDPRIVGSRVDVGADEYSGELRLFRRGDVTGDDSLDLSDGVVVLEYLFLGGSTLPCLDAADANDDQGVDVSDAIFVLRYLFWGTEPPPAPFPECGIDPSLDLLGSCGQAGCR